MQYIYLIRHGQASFGAKNYDQLSSMGLQQAAHLGNYLKPLHRENSLLLRGSMFRHQQTAETAMAQLGQAHAAIQIDGLWNEFNHQQVFERFDPRYADPAVLVADIHAQANSSHALQQIFSDSMRRWMDPAYAEDYDEDWLSFHRRINQAFAQLQHDLQHGPHRHAFVFSSAGVISSLICQLLQLPQDKIAELMFEIANCSLSSIKIDASQLRLQSFNEHQYLHTTEQNLISVI